MAGVWRGGCGSECGEAAARVTDLCGVGRGECTARAAGGDDVDGEGGGEAATGWTSTEQAASVLWRLRARRATMGSGDGGEACGYLCRFRSASTFTEDPPPPNRLEL